MFDTLTRDDLYALHHKLHDEGLAIHKRIMALPSALCDEAWLLRAKHGEIAETMNAVYAESSRREQERLTDV